MLEAYIELKKELESSESKKSLMRYVDQPAENYMFIVCMLFMRRFIYFSNIFNTWCLKKTFTN